MIYEPLKEEIGILIASVQEGEIEARPLYAELKKIEKLIASALIAIKDQATKEQQSYGRLQTEVCGVKMEIMNTGGGWNYDHLIEWNMLKGRVKDFEAASQMNGKAFKKGTDETIKCTFKI